MADLWPDGKKIEVIGATGLHNSGKTVFMLSIAEAKRTLMFDLEKSSASYADIGFDRVDVPDEMRVIAPGGYSQRDLFKWWVNRVMKVKPGQYDVIAVDPINDLEAGMTSWIESRYAEWGFKSVDKFTATGGIFWNYVLSEWKEIILKIATKCQTFGFTTHMKHEWKGNRPTDILLPKGKTTLFALASLYVRLEREENAVPSGYVLKDRLGRPIMKDGRLAGMMPLLPRRLPVATPDAIRGYILAPCDYENPTEAERVPERVFTAAQRLSMEQDIANDNKVAAEANLAATITEEKMRAKRMEVAAKLAAKKAEVLSAPTSGKEATNGAVKKSEIDSLIKFAKSKDVGPAVEAAIKKEQLAGTFTRKRYDKFTMAVAVHKEDK